MAMAYGLGPWEDCYCAGCRGFWIADPDDIWTRHDCPCECHERMNMSHQAARNALVAYLTRNGWSKQAIIDMLLDNLSESKLRWFLVSLERIDQKRSPRR